MRSRTRKCAAAVVTALVAMTLSSRTAFAQPPPEVFKVEADLVSGILTVHGRNFGSGPGWLVLGGVGEPDLNSRYQPMDLTVQSWTDVQLVAQLPSIHSSGTYRLAILTRGNGKNPGGRDLVEGGDRPSGAARSGGRAGTAWKRWATRAGGSGWYQGPQVPLAGWPNGPAGAERAIQAALGQRAPPERPARRACKAHRALKGHLGHREHPERPVHLDPRGHSARPDLRECKVRRDHRPSLSHATLPLTATTVNRTNEWFRVATPIDLSSPSGRSVVALVEAEGDVLLMAAASNYAKVELRLVVDGVVERVLRTSILNYLLREQSAAWRLHTLITLPEGAHQFYVEAHTTTVSGGGSVIVNSTPGRLSVALLGQ